MVHTLPEALNAAAAEHPDGVFLHCASEDGGPAPVTFAALEERSRRVATGLLARGLRPGDRVAVAAPNQVEWLELFFGATRIGLIVVTLNIRYRERELDHMLNQSGAKLLVTSVVARDFDFESFYAGFRERVPDLGQILFLGGRAPGGRYRDLPADTPSGEAEALGRQVRPEDPAVILYTSGTTGMPKGAVLTHASLLAAGRIQAERAEMTPDDVVLGLMPLNHVGGITCSVMVALLSGARLVLGTAFSPEAALRDIEAHRATVFGGVPTMWTLMLAHESFERVDTSSLRLATIGGSNAEPTLCRAIAEGFPQARLSNLYGLSEVSGACVLSAVDDDLETVSRSIGTPLSDVAVRIVGPDGRDLPPGKDGELYVRSPGTAAGYWGMPEATAETFPGGGWVATGDMAALEPDGRHLVLRGRRKEMFIQGGYNVYPVEVENVLTAHPGVSMAAGIGVPDPVHGEIGCYYIVPRDPQRPPEGDELKAFCAGRLADYKVPRRIEIVPDLPLTVAGKIAKARLREQYRAS
ncbi:MAG TPA: class I adenylate-forming enzyme family protein [Gammaproteobacteria bacterium]|nr:class I adenylate-forming enzyme family protein [Gammaproteobacteria bacterium]